MSKKSKLKKQLAAVERRLKRRQHLRRVAKTKDGSVLVPKAPMKISDAAIGMSRASRDRVQALADRIYLAAQPMPGVVPEGRVTMAMDANIKRASQAAAMALDQQIIVAGGWGGSFGGGSYGAFAEGQAFLGYPYLSELAQRPEYRVISETIATEMTRKGIKIQAKGSAGDKSEAISQLEDELKRLRVMELLCKCAEYDGFMGRSHLYLDFDDAADNPDELKTPVGDGLNDITRGKVKQSSLKRLQAVEAVWSYPARYNSNDPLSPDWYKPQLWYAMGKEIHASRFLTFIGREVPDMLKPAYSFGGLSMSQMAKPYIDNFLRTRQSVSDITHAFTVWDLATDLNSLLTPGGEGVLQRVKLFTEYRDNKGMMLTNKETEELKNISAQLGTLDALQAQSQEQMCSVARTPTVKLLGIQPAGLNASSEGEIRVWYDFVHSQQPKLFGANLDRIFRFAQINLWGEVDPDLSYDWVNLWNLDEKQVAEVQKIEADTDAVLVEIGAIDAQEVRTRVAGDEETPYASLDLNKEIIPPAELGETGGAFNANPRIGQGGGLGGNVSSEFSARDEYVLGNFERAAE